MRRVFLLLFCFASMPVLAQQGAQRPGAPPASPAPQAGPAQDRAVNVINRAAVAITTQFKFLLFFFILFQSLHLQNKITN